MSDGGNPCLKKNEFDLLSFLFLIFSFLDEKMATRAKCEIVHLSGRMLLFRMGSPVTAEKGDLSMGVSYAADLHF